MSPFKSSAGRALGKMLEGFKSSDVGKGFGSGDGGTVILQATGGEVALGSSQDVDNRTYRYHYFKTPGTLVLPDAGNFDGQLEVLIIAGGGAGGQRSGGGGGAGGIALAQDIPFGSTTGQISIPITVGAGGIINTASEGAGRVGGDSRFGGPGDSWNVLAKGGGGGGGDNPPVGLGGGSGGGGHYSSPGGAGNQPSQNPGKAAWVTNYGFPGQIGHGAPEHNSGAGGGAGGAALPGSSSQRGAAGSGVQLNNFNVSYYMPNSDPWWPGISPLPGTHFGGGGGGGDYPPYIPQRMPNTAIYGGGGPGGPNSSAGHGSPGVNGLGGGGGGACGDSSGHNGGRGGDGMVVVRYRSVVVT